MAVGIHDHHLQARKEGRKFERREKAILEVHYDVSEIDDILGPPLRSLGFCWVKNRGAEQRDFFLATYFPFLASA